MQAPQSRHESPLHCSNLILYSHPADHIVLCYRLPDCHIPIQRRFYLSSEEKSLILNITLYVHPFSCDVAR
uniref:Uncharacterized protein n=1 Tax=Physcomitrium patens TaxID=3218 RepID=A0A2K1ILS7_PHYPA|nr:hypothetical protein PHYPA_026546 [Physcomitrium patens]